MSSLAMAAGARASPRILATHRALLRTIHHAVPHAERALGVLLDPIDRGHPVSR